jgi:hypothetical protein
MLSSNLTKRTFCKFCHNKNSSMASQQTSPFLHRHKISSTTQDTKIPIFINLQQTNTLTHIHINCPTFCHFLLSTTKVVSSSIRASLKKKRSTHFHPTPLFGLLTIFIKFLLKGKNWQTLVSTSILNFGKSNVNSSKPSLWKKTPKLQDLEESFLKLPY